MTTTIEQDENDTTQLPITLRYLTSEYAQLVELLDASYDQTEPPANASDDVKREYQEARTACNQALMALLDVNEENVKVKLDGYCDVMNEYRMLAQCRRAEAARLNQLAIADENKIDALKLRLKQFFLDTNQKSVDTNRYKVLLKGDGGIFPLRLADRYIDDPESLPPALRVTKYEPNNEAIRRVIDMEGGEIGTVEVEMDETGTKAWRHLMTMDDDGNVHEIAELLPRGSHIEYAQVLDVTKNKKAKK